MVKDKQGEMKLPDVTLWTKRKLFPLGTSYVVQNPDTGNVIFYRYCFIKSGYQWEGNNGN